jgi:hypothetical protein
VADEVQINNVGGDGIASEVTLARLVAVTEQMAKKAGIDPKDVTKKLKALSSATGDTIKISTKNRAELKKHTKEVSAATKALKFMSSAIGTGLFNSFGAITRSGTEMVKAFAAGEKSLSAFAGHLPLIGGKLSILTGLFDDSFAAFQNVAMSGAAFNGSLTELRNSAADARMSLDAFSGFISQNSFKLTSFGGTATQGAKQIVAMTNSSRATRESLLALGFTFEDINEAMLEYQYITRAGSRGNRLQQKTAEEQAIAAGEYAKHLNTLAKLSGEEAKVGQEAVARKMQDIAFQTALSKLSAEEQLKVQLVMHQAMAAGGQDAVDAVAAKFLGLPAVSESARLYTATMTTQMDTLTSNLVTAQQKDVKQKDMMDLILVSNVDLMKGNAASAKEFETIIAAAGVGVGGTAAMMAGFFNNATLDHVKYLSTAGQFDEAAALEDIKAAKAEGEKRDKALATMVEFTGALSDLQSAFQTQIVTPLMEAVGPALKEMVAAMTGATVDPDTGKYLRDAEGNIIQGENIFANAISSIGTMINNDLAPGILNFINTFKDDPGTAIREMFAKGTAALSGMIKDFFLGAEIIGPLQPDEDRRQGGFLEDSIVPMFKGLGTSLVNGMIDGVKSMWEADPVTTALVAAIGAFFLAPGATIALATGIGSMMAAGVKKMKNFAMPTKPPTNTNTSGAGGPLKKDGTPDKRFKAQAVPKTGWFAPLAKSIVRKAGVAGLLFGAYDIGSTLLDDTKTKDEKQQAVVETGGGMGGAAAGAYAGGLGGAALGTMILPVVGTAIGGALGTIIGGGLGWWAGSSAAGAVNESLTSSREETEKVLPPEAQTPVLAGTSAVTEAQVMLTEKQVKLMERVAVLSFDDFNKGITRLNPMKLSKIATVDFTNFATGLKTFAEIPNLQTQFDAVNSLDTSGVISYTNAMEDLVVALNKVNDELAKDNNGMFSKGTGTNAGDMINSVGGLNNGGGAGSEQLNTIMNQVLAELRLIKGFEESTAKNTKNITSGNIAKSGASVTGN